MVTTEILNIIIICSFEFAVIIEVFYSEQGFL